MVQVDSEMKFGDGDGSANGDGGAQHRPRVFPKMLATLLVSGMQKMVYLLLHFGDGLHVLYQVVQHHNLIWSWVSRQSVDEVIVKTKTSKNLAACARHIHAIDEAVAFPPDPRPS